MRRNLDRREFIQLAGLATAGVAGVVFSSGLRGVSFAAGKGRAEDFVFLQMSDKAIVHVNALPNQPDFIVFTGDLTHTTDDPQEMGSSAGRALKEFKRALGELGEEAPKIETCPAGEDRPHAGESRPVS